MGLLLSLTLILALMSDLSLPYGIKLYLISGIAWIGLVWNRLGPLYRLYGSRRNYILISVTAFIVWLLLSILWSSSPVDSLKYSIKFLFLAAFSLALFQVLSSTSQYLERQVFNALFFAILVVSGVVLVKLHLFGVDSVSLMFAEGLVGSGNPVFSHYIEGVFYSFPIANSQNYISSYLVVLLASLMWIGYSFDDLRARVAELTACFLVALVALISLSKTGIVSLIILVAALFLYRKYWGFLISFFIALILLSNILSLADGVESRFLAMAGGVAEESYQDNSVSSRHVLWNEAVRLIKESPLIGHGLRATMDNFNQLLPEDNNVIHPHNIFLQVMVDLGIVGFLLLLWWWISIAYEGYSIAKDRSHLRQILFVMLIWLMIVMRGMFGFQLEELDMWFLLGLTMAKFYSFDYKHREAVWHH